MGGVGRSLLHLGLLLAGACTEPAGLPDGGAPDLAAPPDAAPAALGGEVLLYYGNGGIPPGELPSQQFSYARFTAALAGRKVSHTGTWPAALDPFALVVLILPGATTDGRGLDEAQQAQLGAWVDRGGRLVLQAEWTWSYGRVHTLPASRASNALMRAMGGDAAVEGYLSRAGLMPLDPLDPLGKNVDRLTCREATALGFRSSPTLRRVDVGNDITVVALTRGRGEVVFIADSSCLDDSTPHGAELESFAANLLRPRG